MIGNDWDEKLKIVWESDGFKKFMNIIKDKYKTNTCFPEYSNIFNALKLSSFENTKVVILGQDPYHGTGEAHGLSFSVQDGIKKPPSLKNIYKELKDDLKIEEALTGNLTPWAKEGVQLFTDHIIKLLNEKETPVVFILWGNFARNKKKFITNKRHLIIESAHPSPFSAYNGFFGSKPFSKTNKFLINTNQKPINWDLKRVK